ncbi:unnamed protein product [Chilo suppressalis]|uniref:Hexosyltransferase n=1 Tax=Chilo suppressalis TaxID=168631 RepID=A0ABN8L9E4_CHISP|nr:unnamed protein product [Chilo suppressalis]
MFSRFVVSQVKHNSYFLVGVVLGLWLALVAVPFEEAPVACPATEAPAPDEYEPHREARPLGPAGPVAGRSVQRPRYYITELGMRGSLMSGVLSSEEALSTRTAALNATASRLQPLRVFIAAAAGAVPPRPNVVGFTDTREMLKPFHALKYLADNCLEEYDFFFLVSDTSFVNARRLRDLVSKLSVSQDVYMGTVAEDDSHYCTLEGGILLSNSVLRAVHGQLDWCVRNSYSAHHHENIGRCVLHAAQQRCRAALQGETYTSIRLSSPEQIPPTLADAVTVYPVHEPAHFYRLHAAAARRLLQRAAATAAGLRRQMAALRPNHPPGFANTSWPAGLRADPGLAPPTPENRFEHLRWTLFNASHSFMPDDHRAIAPLKGSMKEAVQLVLRESIAWASRRWGVEYEDVRLVEGASRWEPALGLRYRLLLRARQRVMQLEVIIRTQNTNDTTVSTLRDQLSSVVGQQAHIVEISERADISGPLRIHADNQRRALLAALKHPAVTSDALVVLLPSHADYNQEFLNRARMNTISGWQWFWAVGFARYSLHPSPAPPSAPSPSPSPLPTPTPHHHTGRFAPVLTDALAFYRTDFENALSSWGPSVEGSVAQILGASPLRCVRAPEPALVLAPRPPPLRPPCPPSRDLPVSLPLTRPRVSARPSRRTLRSSAVRRQAFAGQITARAEVRLRRVNCVN